MEYLIIERNTINLKNIKIKEMIWNKIKAALILWAKWDALWVPTEMMTYDQIRETFWWTVSKYENAINNWFFREHWISDNIKWFWSDDTVLSIALTQSIINKWKIDYDDLIQSQITAYKGHPWGFWKATKQAFLNIENWIPYTQSWIKETWWNWTVMKQFILAAYFLLNNYTEQQIINTIQTVVRMTHNNSVPVIASIIHNKLLMELLTVSEINKIELLEKIINYCEHYENQFNDITDKLSVRLKKMFNYFDQSWNLNITDKEIIYEFWRWDNSPKSSWYINITLPVVYCLFFRNPSYEWLIDAVNIWWDTDTFAAIIWNMIWALSWDEWPKQLNNELKDYDKINDIAEIFIQKFVQSN